ncbi:MAG TPA: SGNH/GDSL hydrolase family protein [Polyangiaceae bacterium]|nr:SGNH/GDSL hydrolase family protein [Polyangiaceae bacterium]
MNSKNHSWLPPATRSIWLLGALALCANVACSGTDSNGGASSGGGGTTSTPGGSAGKGGSATGGSPTVSAAGSAGSVTSVAGSGGAPGGVAGSIATGGTGGAAGGAVGQAGSPGKAAGGSGGTSAGGSGGATAGASAGGGSSGGATGFDPCPATGDCKVLPLGDSITFGTPTNNGGYRVELFTKAVGDNLHITFVGSQSNGPAMVAGKPFPKGNEGYPGITTANLDSQHVKGTALKDMPNIILLHIGTNNVSQANAASDLEKIIDDLVSAAPNSLLAVASIIPLPNSSSAVDKYNAGIPALVQKKATAGKHVIFVDQFKDFPTSELTDGVHPTDDKGYPRMGDKWYAAIKPYLH